MIVMPARPVIMPGVVVLACRDTPEHAEQHAEHQKHEDADQQRRRKAGIAQPARQDRRDDPRHARNQPAIGPARLRIAIVRHVPSPVTRPLYRQAKV